VLEGTDGRLVALRNGSYVNVPIEVVRQGVKRADVDALYDVDEYRPKIRHVDGKPMFLY
jgi:6-phosphofructokinase 1